mmetsp:Transcript_31446/g.73759  ORF Transcript_31446/g.73759 Transcript_31446/m.73759 type:complete len:206 (-) Transcript_31446:25-642(-)
MSPRPAPFRNLLALNDKVGNAQSRGAPDNQSAHARSVRRPTPHRAHISRSTAAGVPQPLVAVWLPLSHCDATQLLRCGAFPTRRRTRRSEQFGDSFAWNGVSLGGEPGDGGGEVSRGQRGRGGDARSCHDVLLGAMEHVTEVGPAETTVPTRASVAHDGVHVLGVELHSEPLETAPQLGAAQDAVLVGVEEAEGVEETEPFAFDA